MTEKENKKIKDMIENEIVPYQEYKSIEFFDLACNIVDDCQLYSPWLLFTRESVNDIVEVLSDNIDFKNPFTLQDDDLETDSEEEFSS
jgi:hypothetical protein